MCKIILKKYNVKRVVLSRETPLEEIKRIRDNCDIEIEYFAHGALCVSFSGNCYLSSYLHDASGNRGKCKQLCRLPYTFEKNGKIVAEQFENLTLQCYITGAFDMGLYRFRLDVLNVDCVPRMTVGLVNHRSKK